MATASDFLVRLAEGNSANGDHENKKEKKGKGVASSFLQNLAESETEKQVQLAGQLMPQLYQDIQKLEIPKVNDQESYYSRPIVDTSNVESISGRLDQLVTAMQYSDYPVKKAEEAVTKAASNLLGAASALKGKYDAYTESPTQASADAYNQALVDYNRSKQEYDAAYSTYKSAYDIYQQNTQTYDQIYSAWNNYVQQSQASYDAWKGTIRDPETIQAELDAIDAQIKQRKQNGQDGPDIGIPFVDNAADQVRDALGIGPMVDAKTGKYGYQALLEKRALLQEEYDWAVYGDLMDIRSTPYFGSLSKNDRLLVIDMTQIQKVWSDKDRANFENWIIARRNAPDDVLAWADKIGWDRLEELESSLRRYQNQKSAERTVKEAQDAANSLGGFGNFLASRATVAANLWSAIESPFAVAQELLWYDDRYGNLDPNGPGFKTSIWSGTVRDTVAGNIRGDKYDENGNLIKDGGVWGDIGATVYGAGMSAVDNLARLALAYVTGGGSTVSVGLAALGSFGEAVRQTSEQGGSPLQALAMGVISGALEGLTEKYSVDKLLKIGKGDPLNLKKIIKEAIIQGGVEVSEEEINFVASTIAEAAIMQEKSSYNLQVKALMDKGMSEEKAREQAGRELLEQAAQIAAESFLSGVMMTSAVGAVNNATVKQKGKELGLDDITKESAQAIIDEGLLSGKDTDAYKMAQKLQKKLEAGKLPTEGELYQQLAANQKAIEAEETNAISEPLDSYPQEKQKTIRSFLRSTDAKIKSFVQSVRNGDLSFRRQKISDVSARAAADIGRLLNIDVSGYTHNINTSGVQHILNRHGESGKQDRSMASDADIARIGWVLENYDTVELLERDGQQVYSSEFKDKNGQPVPQIRFVKKIDGTYYVVEAAYENGYKKMWVQSAYLTKKEDVTQVSAEGQSANHKTYAQSELASPSSNLIIDQGGGIVNNNNQNGGNENGNAEGQADSTEGAGVLHGGNQRNAGTGTGKQAGGLERSTEGSAQRQAEVLGRNQVEAANARQNLARSLGLAKVSAQEVGIPDGTDDKDLQVIPQEHWDPELQRLADKTRRETGLEPVFVIGNIYIKGKDFGRHKVRGAITDEKLILQANYTRYSLDQILDHEIYHYKAAFVRDSGHNLQNMNQLAILDRFSKEELSAVLDVYLKELDGIYGVSKALAEGNDDAYNDALAIIKEEMMADAYAGINAFGAHAERFTQAVNERMESLHLGNRASQENGVRQTNGPNGEKENTAKVGGARFSADDNYLSDEYYAKAIKIGDIRLAKEMVLQAAYEAGLRVAAAHGSPEFGFTEFKRHKSFKKGAYYFTDNMLVAESYSGVKGKTPISSGAKQGNYSVALDIKKPLVVDCNYSIWNNLPFDIGKPGSGKNGEVKTYDVVEWAEKRGYDAVIFKNVFDLGPLRNYSDLVEASKRTKYAKEKIAATVYAVFESNQIKSLDPVTYDDKGNVIPLSKRFNFKKKDIRYSVDDTTESGMDVQERDARIAEILDSVSTNHRMQFERYTRLTEEDPALAAKEAERLSSGIYGSQFDEYRELTEQRDREKKNTAQTDGAGDSENDGITHKIYPGMDDGQRAEILMQKKFYAPIYDNSNSITGAQILKLKGKYVTAARKLLSGLAEQCGDFHIDLYNADIDMSFLYSNRSLKESINKQSKRGGTAETFGKMLTLLPEICESAVEIEAHTDRYVDTARADGNLKEMHILVGAFVDGNDCIPVQLEIKEYILESRLKNKLYVTVTMKNEAGVTPRISNANMASENTRSRPASIVSLAEMIANVKDHTGGLVKYLPDQMLTEEQQNAKRKALADDETQIGDMRYAYAVEQGNTQAAQRMLKDKAEQAGYSASDDWRMTHRAPNRNSGVTIDNADEMYGGDGSIHSPLAHRYYGEGRDYDIKAIAALRKAWSNPGGSIKVYRAVPADIADDRLRNGDWVSPTHEYAQEHGERYFENGFRIIEQDVPVQQLYVDGNSIHEFGYDNGRTTEVYKNTPNNVKLTEITYDDNGELIPISQRYDETKRDARYSADDGDLKDEEQVGGQYTMDTEAFYRLKGEMEARDKEWRENFLLNELGEEGLQQYKATARVENARKKAEQAQKAKENRKTSEKIELDVEVRATQAKAILEKKLLDDFYIPAGMRNEMRGFIDGFADRIVQHGALTEADRQRFFQRMYETGAVTIPADEYYGEARSYIKGGHIYVSPSVVADLGDDWQDLRRRAFAAGIYLTNERTFKDGRTVAGVDVWNEDLAASLPGLFDAEETDASLILEKIIHVAELGKDDKISLAEYVSRIAKEEYTSENEVLEDLERKMMYALKAFAETAQVEIQLKERNLRRVMKERRENQERAQRAKERRELQELQQKTLKSLQWLAKNRRLAPEDLREEWNNAISDIDLYAVGAANEMNWSNRFQATWKDVKQMAEEAVKDNPFLEEDKEIKRILSRLDDRKIADMDPGALMDLYKLATGLRTAFYNRNNVLEDEKYRLFSEMYTEVREELEAAGKNKHGIADRLMNLEQLSAMNVLEQMAGWNPNSAWYSMAKQLERGERDVRAFTVKANRILEEFLREHKEWVMKADGQGKDAIWYEIEVPELLEWGKGNKPIFGDSVKVYMTPAQKVHMYLESKNLDNLRHMEGGRTFVVDKELYGKGKRQEALAGGRTIRLAPETVKQLVSNLTDEEMELAQVLNQYYNRFATGEINRVSNVLYGYDKAMGKNYAPIYTNQNYTMAEFGAFDVTAEGVGNMKGRVQFSKNPSYNISAFDAFERNVNQTARFVGMAIPIRNWTTLMNWTGEKSSTKDVIDHSWGLEYHQYIDDLLVDMQGGKLDREDFVSEGAERLMSNYISAVFGFNMSIVLKQMGSIPLAGAYLGVGNVIPGQAQVQRLDRSLIAKYTQDLAWRGMGYSMPETKQLKDHPNWTQNNKAVRFAVGGGAITVMDQLAASMLWPWAENKVRKEHPELEYGTQEQINNGESPFYKKVAEEFENAVARSQSTSDQMHQSRARKSKNTFTRVFTLFTSDSAQTYNTLRQMIGEAGYYSRNGIKKKAAGARRAIGVAFTALLLNALWGEAVNLLAALIKNKGKKYRDEEGDFTAESMLSQMLMGMLSSVSGTVLGGDTVVDLIGSKITGEKFYAPEAMEISLIQDMFMLADSTIGNVIAVISDAADVVANGGDLGEYIKQNGKDILGQIKDAALELASYFGIPASNMEAYLFGLLKFIPGFEAVYDGVFESADKDTLAGLSGLNLEIRIGDIMERHGVNVSDDVTEKLAQLYEEGYQGAVPGKTPSQVSIDGEERELNGAQQQMHAEVWADVVGKYLESVVASERFTEADPKIREAMLKKLYSYANEQAKAELFDDYKPNGMKDDVADYENAGMDIADYLRVKAEDHNTDKYLEAVIAGLPEEKADELMDSIDALKPEEGEERVENVRKWRTCVNMFGDSAHQLAALAAYMTDDQIKKARLADYVGVDLSNYVRLYEIRTEYDANGNKSFSGAEYKKAIDSMHLSNQESAMLWQLATGSKSAKNNPYSSKIGQKVIDAMDD